MPTESPPPATIEFGVNYPSPDSLRTGDVLFARAPTARAVISVRMFSDAELQMTVAEYLGNALTLEVALMTGDPSLIETISKRQDGIHVGTRALSSKSREVAFVLLLLLVEFKGLVHDWFGTNLLQFITTPLVELLLKAFSGTLQDGFFIGHCAVVLREQDGASTDRGGEVFVIEANATSFAHYGVNVRPYHVPQDGLIGTGRYRSWAASRAANGDHVWQSRHPALQHDGAPSAPAREAILRSAKTYLGRGYSFFDNASFADSGRLYCSEFIYAAFRDAELGRVGLPPQPSLVELGKTVRTWRWMKDNNPADTELGKVVRQVLTHPMTRHLHDKAFFILTVQMLWRTGEMTPFFSPGGEPYQ